MHTTCPHCGRCPHCGQPSNQLDQQFRHRPAVQPTPQFPNQFPPVTLNDYLRLTAQRPPELATGLSNEFVSGFSQVANNPQEQPK